MTLSLNKSHDSWSCNSKECLGVRKGLNLQGKYQKPRPSKIKKKSILSFQRRSSPSPFHGGTMQMSVVYNVSHHRSVRLMAGNLVELMPRNFNYYLNSAFGVSTINLLCLIM